MQIFTTDGKTADVFPSIEAEAPIIYLHTFSNEGQQVLEAAQAADCPPFTLVSIRNLNWNLDMVPWDSPPAFKSASPFIGAADNYLRILIEEIIPSVEKEITGIPCWRGIAGYSLAGLFALYAIYKTDLFSRVASISGSLWFPGIKAYILSQAPKRWPEHLYFSLGNKESKTKNQVLKDVQQNTEEMHAFYQDKGIDTVFQLNSGNHYNHAVERTAAGTCWLLSR